MAPPRRAANAPHHWRKSHATVRSAPGKFEKFQAASQISHSDLTLSTDCFYANPVFVREEKGGGSRLPTRCDTNERKTKRSRSVEGVERP